MNSAQRIIALFSILIFGSVTPVGLYSVQAFEPLRNPKRLRSVKKETALRVTRSRLILVDYDLLKQDFPFLISWKHEKIDHWLLEQAGFVAKTQTEQTETNTPISVDFKKQRTAYRPKDYGRALVFEAREKDKLYGLIDAKGAGAIEPTPGDHSNGLASLGESIREFLYEKLVSKILNYSQIGIDTVGTYAVLDLGFDIRFENNRLVPAGMTLRQAHRRAPGDVSSLNGRQSLAVESALRKFGVTSAGAHRNEDIELINIQGVDGGQAIIDFGAFLTVPWFEKSAKNFDGKRILLHPQRDGFIQPDPELRVPFDLWGFSITGKDDPQWDNPWIWSHELALALRSGQADRSSVEQHFRNLVIPFYEKMNRLCGHLLSSKPSE